MNYKTIVKEVHPKNPKYEYSTDHYRGLLMFDNSEIAQAVHDKIISTNYTDEDGEDWDVALYEDASWVLCVGNYIAYDFSAKCVEDQVLKVIQEAETNSDLVKDLESFVTADHIS